jgi:hypothetical protein
MAEESGSANNSIGNVNGPAATSTGAVPSSSNPSSMHVPPLPPSTSEITSDVMFDFSGLSVDQSRLANVIARQPNRNRPTFETFAALARDRYLAGMTGVYSSDEVATGLRKPISKSILNTATAVVAAASSGPTLSSLTTFSFATTDFSFSSSTPPTTSRVSPPFSFTPPTTTVAPIPSTTSTSSAPFSFSSVVSNASSIAATTTSTNGISSFSFSPSMMSTTSVMPVVTSSSVSTIASSDSGGGSTTGDISSLAGFSFAPSAEVLAKSASLAPQRRYCIVCEGPLQPPFYSECKARGCDQSYKPHELAKASVDLSTVAADAAAVVHPIVARQCERCHQALLEGFKCPICSPVSEPPRRIAAFNTWMALLSPDPNRRTCASCHVSYIASGEALHQCGQYDILGTLSDHGWLTLPCSLHLCSLSFLLPALLPFN